MTDTAPAARVTAFVAGRVQEWASAGGPAAWRSSSPGRPRPQPSTTAGWRSSPRAAGSLGPPAARPARRATVERECRPGRALGGHSCRALPARTSGVRRALSPHDGGVSTLPPDLERLRGSIDNIDAALVHLLAERFAHPGGRLAQGRAGYAARRPAREERQVARLRALADEAGLDPVSPRKFLSPHHRRGDPPPRGPVDDPRRPPACPRRRLARIVRPHGRPAHPVYVKSVTMRGFLSFASATTLRLEPGIT